MLRGLDADRPICTCSAAAAIINTLANQPEMTGVAPACPELPLDALAPRKDRDSMGTIHVQALDHVTLVVKDLERSRRFYVDVLGMAEVPRPGFSFPGLWFQAGATQIHLILESAESGPSGQPAGAREKSSRHQHFAFRVADARAAAGRFEELGVPFVARPKERPDGYLQVFVTDPDGHIVELCSAP
jgi:catechol 2,3-dioxygenase-like lactoylglutathione lyase family enzyme